MFSVGRQWYKERLHTVVHKGLVQPEHSEPKTRNKFIVIDCTARIREIRILRGISVFLAQYKIGPRGSLDSINR